MAADTSNDYDQLKTAILRRYSINEETYQQRFRLQKMKTGESPKELVTYSAHRLSNQMDKRLYILTSPKVSKQCLEGLSEDVRLHVSERKPKRPVGK